MQVGNNGIIGTTEQKLSETGMHQFIEVSDKKGKTLIFDNMHPDGIDKEKYIEIIGGFHNSKGHLEGKEIFQKYVDEI